MLDIVFWRRGETVAFKKAPQNLYKGDGDGFRLCNSVCSPILLRPSPQEIVLGRLRGRIRRLFDVGAVIRVENDVGFDQRATYSL